MTRGPPGSSENRPTGPGMSNLGPRRDRWQPRPVGLKRGGGGLVERQVGSSRAKHRLPTTGGGQPPGLVIWGKIRKVPDRGLMARRPRPRTRGRPRVEFPSTTRRRKAGSRFGDPDWPPAGDEQAVGRHRLVLAAGSCSRFSPDEACPAGPRAVWPGPDQGAISVQAWRRRKQ